MFHIKDLINRSEFIRKLNDKFSNINLSWGNIEGKPELFPPEEHTHDVVTEDKAGFVTKEILEDIYDISKTVPNTKIWYDSRNESAINFNGLSYLYSNTLGINVRIRNSEQLSQGCYPNINLFQATTIYADMSDYSTLNISLNWYGNDDMILGSIRRLHEYITFCNINNLQLPDIYIPINFIIANCGLKFYNSEIKWGKLQFGDLLQIGAVEEDYLNIYSDVGEYPYLYPEYNSPDYFSLFKTEYFYNNDSIQIYSSVMYLSESNTRFFKKFGQLSDTILKAYFYSDQVIEDVTYNINGYLKLNKGKCEFISL